MEKIKRADSPDWLKQNWKQWGEEWASLCNKSTDSSSFKWKPNKEGYNELLEILSKMTEYHCSYCDSYPMKKRIKSTIDHFKPKISYPLEAYRWENLFLCCHLCQERNNKYDPLLLKPDEYDFEFDRYFDIDWVTGEIIPNRIAPEEDRKRAELTIQLFKLNENGKPEDRMEELGKFQDSNNRDIDKYSYRFYISRGIV